ncbi:MAG: LysR substrate-binding domain-containing protein [Myxococcota bacterium]
MAIDLNDVLAFNAVAALGSFTAAGKSLGLDPSAVSRRVARLEERLDAKLLHRTTRQVGLTEAGRRFHERTRTIGTTLEEATKAVHDQKTEPTGLVRITAPPDDGGNIWALLEGFVRAHPNVDLEVIHTLEYLDLVAEGIDIALRGGALTSTSEFAGKKLFDSRMMLAASPAYLDARGVPQTARDLEHHDCIAMDMWAPGIVQRLEGVASPVQLNLRNRIRTNRLDTMQAAALAGFGIAPLLEMNCRRDLQEGRLVEVLPGVLPPNGEFWALYPARRALSAAASALLQHMCDVAPTI